MDPRPLVLDDDRRSTRSSGRAGARDRRLARHRAGRGARDGAAGARPSCSSGTTRSARRAAADALVARGARRRRPRLRRRRSRRRRRGCRDELGPLAEPDVIVCAAGVMSERTAKTLRTTPQEWRRVHGHEPRRRAARRRGVRPRMIARRDGRIVTVSACLGRMSGPGTAGGLAAYRVSKAALNALHEEPRGRARRRPARGARRRHVPGALPHRHGRRRTPRARRSRARPPPCGSPPGPRSRSRAASRCPRVCCGRTARSCRGERVR